MKPSEKAKAKLIREKVEALRVNAGLKLHHWPERKYIR